MNIDRFAESKPVVLIDAGTALAATVTGNSIDTQFYRSLTGVLDIAISAGSVDSVKFQESSDNGVADAWADVQEDESLFYPDDYPIAADAVKHVGCIAKERYVRVVLTCTGPTGTVGSAGLLQDSLTQPMVKESSVLADADVTSPGTTGDAASTPPKR